MNGAAANDRGSLSREERKSAVTESRYKHRWAYGITTIPGRRDTLLPQTLTSLRNAGFTQPRLFIDGAMNHEAKWWEDQYGLEVTCRYPRIKLFGNWSLALGELYIRNPEAERFAIFQDDIIACKGLLHYLDRSKYPDKGYWNLYTFPENQKRFKRIGQTARFEEGWTSSDQRGLGALGLVFDRESVIRLLTQRKFVDRPLDKIRGWRGVDGGVLWALRAEGWTEYVHNPSLVQHTGTVSSFDKGKNATGDNDKFAKFQWPRSSYAVSFKGEDWDATSLL